MCGEGSEEAAEDAEDEDSDSEWRREEAADDAEEECSSAFCKFGRCGDDGEDAAGEEKAGLAAALRANCESSSSSSSKEEWDEGDSGELGVVIAHHTQRAAHKNATAGDTDSQGQHNHSQRSDRLALITVEVSVRA